MALIIGKAPIIQLFLHNLSDSVMHEEKRPKVGISIVVVKNNMILLGKRRGSHGAGTWSFPGGHLEFKETIDGCTKRELIEETGLKALNIIHGPWTDDVIDNDKHYITLFIVVNKFEGELKLQEPHKCEEWKWFEYMSLPSPLFLPVQSLLKKICIEELVKI